MYRVGVRKHPIIVAIHAPETNSTTIINFAALTTIQTFIFFKKNCDCYTQVDVAKGAHAMSQVGGAFQIVEDDDESYFRHDPPRPECAREDEEDNTEQDGKKKEGDKEQKNEDTVDTLKKFRKKRKVVVKKFRRKRSVHKN